MSDNKPSKSDIRSENSDMAFTAEAVRAEMQGHVKRVAALAAEDGRKAALRFAAGVLKIPYGRVRSLFYGEARRIDAHEADQIRAYVEAAHKLIQARAEYEALRVQYLAAAHPNLARFAPRPLADDAVSQEAEQAVTGDGSPPSGTP